MPKSKLSNEDKLAKQRKETRRKTKGSSIPIFLIKK